MCGVYNAVWGKLTDEFFKSLQIINSDFKFEDRYAIRVTNSAPVVVPDVSGHNKLELMKFGLIPSWRKYEKMDFSTFNAKAETVAELKTYAKPFRQSRGLAVATGFFEFKTVMVDGKPEKHPFYFSYKGDKPFVMAVIWDRNEVASDKPILSFSIVTTEPNSVVKPIHHRAPLILTPEKALEWLNPDNDVDQLKKLMKPTPAEDMQVWEVARLVNNFRNPDSPDLIKPI